jgi:hypothetical protein
MWVEGVAKMIHPVPKKLYLPSERKATKKKCVELAKKIVRSKGFCEKCGKTKESTVLKPGGWKLEGAHIFSVSFSNTAAMTYNIVCLCSYCHTLGKDSAHKSPEEFKIWIQKKFPGRYEMLQAIANTTGKKNDWSMIYIGLQAEEKMAKFGGIK